MTEAGPPEKSGSAMVPGDASSQVAAYAEVPRRTAPRPIVIKSALRHFLVFIFLLLISGVIGFGCSLLLPSLFKAETVRENCNGGRIFFSPTDQNT